jgi:RNA 3'-terminal phosphate cyclase (ATP)
MMLVLDGSHGEGGGQILRTGLTLAVLTEQPVRIERIRAGRKKPGLRPQHLTAVQAAATVCNARLEVDALGSQTLTFLPGGPARPGEYIFDVAEATRGGSAGSVGLVLQTVLLPLALADGESYLVLRGGTHVPWAPPVSYLEHVFLPTLARMGLHAEVESARWGFYPAGGGEAHVQIVGRSGGLAPISLVERGEFERIWGMAVVTNLPAHIAQRMAARAHNVLAEASLQSEVEPRRLHSSGPGAGIFLFAEYAHTIAGFTAYGRKGLPAEQVAEAACDELLAHHYASGAADPHLIDQLVLPMALAAGKSQVTTSQVTHHLLTNVWVVRQFLTRELNVEGELGMPGTLLVEGEAYD